jgi:hypothetical protein
LILRRAAAGLLAALCAVFCLWLAWHHPLAAPAVMVGCMMLAALAVARPVQWPLWLLPLLPWLSWMPWTGWLVVEEFDLAVLAVAAAGYLRLALGWAATGYTTPRSTRRLAATLLWMLPLLLATLWALQRGVVDAGGLSFGWWQGYREPLNSLRLAKPLLEVLLLLPLWHAASRVDAPLLGKSLMQGMVVLLLGVAAVVWWERLAFTGLLDFATDYRATGPFWEMHVGGAALDAALALALPFAVAALVGTQGRGPWAWVTALAVAMGLYAALVTFSRIVYAAVPLGLLLWWLFRSWHRPAAEVASGQRATWSASLWWMLWLAAFSASAWWCFPSSGYRGLLALVGVVALLLPLNGQMRSLPPAQRVLGLGLGMLGAAGVAAAAVWWPKGAYLAYALVWAASAAALLQSQRLGAPGNAATPMLAILGWAGFVSTLAASVAVAWHWGGASAWAPHLTVAAALLALALVCSARVLTTWPAGWRWQGSLLGAIVAAAALLGVFQAGGYMGGRMAASAQDGQDRRAHWTRAVALLSTTDWALGKGLGRYWANQSLSGLPQDQTGDYRWVLADGGPAVILTSGRHDLGPGEALRLSQRVDLPAPGEVTLKLTLRISGKVKLQAEVCEKHLLYPANCLEAEQQVEAAQAAWQSVVLKLKGAPLTRGAALAPRTMVFSLSLGSHQNRAEIRQMSLTDALGRELLGNGDFSQGLTRWYFSSDRYHLPWHAKNMVVHLLFEQGLIGLGAFALLAGVALWRVTLGAARRHAMAPVLAAAMVGLLTVGVVDSLLDMPRVAFLVLLLLMVMVALPAADQPAAAR